jgi:hypothetical protein
MCVPGMFQLRSSIRLLIAVALVCCAAAIISAQEKQKQPAAQAAKPAPNATIDPALIGVWGVDEQGGYDFRADGTFIMAGSVTYRFDASKGVWHYWQPATPTFKTAADYKISADGKSLSINLKTGKPFTHLKKIK